MVRVEEGVGQPSFILAKNLYYLLPEGGRQTDRYGLHQELAKIYLSRFNFTIIVLVSEHTDRNTHWSGWGVFQGGESFSFY